MVRLVFTGALVGGVCRGATYTNGCEDILEFVDEIDQTGIIDVDAAERLSDPDCHGKH